MSFFTTSVSNVLRRHFVTPFGKTADHRAIYMSTIEVVEISNTIFKILVTAAFVETVLRLQENFAISIRKPIFVKFFRSQTVIFALEYLTLPTPIIILLSHDKSHQRIRVPAAAQQVSKQKHSLSCHGKKAIGKNMVLTLQP